MGEKIRTIKQIELKDISMDIELNDGTAKSRETKYIHLQNDRVRLALSDREYVEMAVAINTAARKIRKYKKPGTV